MREATEHLGVALACGGVVVVVVGGGLTGIEAASEFAEAGRNVTLVTGALGPSLAKGGRRSVAKRLSKLGVTVVDNETVTQVQPDRIALRDGKELPSAATVWTAGFGVPTLAADSGLSTDRLGRLLTDETLTSVDDPAIIAAGDAASPSAQPLRMSCQLAMPLASHAADTVLLCRHVGTLASSNGSDCHCGNAVTRKRRGVDQQSLVAFAYHG